MEYVEKEANVGWSLCFLHSISDMEVLFGMKLNSEDKKEAIKKAIKDFFSAVDILKELDVMRSDRYLGDLGEYLARQCDYNIELAKNLRNKGYDGTSKSGEKVEVKFHNSTKGRNVSLGDPNTYGYVIVVLGPKSRLRNSAYEGDFLLYKLSASDVAENHLKPSKCSAGKRPFDRKPDFTF